MPIAEKTIISPDDQKPGVPLKKSTLGAIAGVLAVVAVVSAVMMNGGSTVPQEAVGVPPKVDDDTSKKATTGTATEIEDEAAKARAKLEEERKQAAHAAAEAEKQREKERLAQGAPIPAGLRQQGQTAALYEPAGGRGVAGGAGGANVEAEAAARTSKSLAFDSSDAGEAPRQPSPYAQTSSQIQRVNATLETQANQQAQIRPASASLPSGDMALERYRAEMNKGQSATNAGWLREMSSGGGQNKVIKSYETASRYTLHQGKVIPAVLGRKIISDMPGDIIAHTTIDVYDSLGNGVLLIPKGSTLVGQYNSEVKAGQSRVMFAFQRLVMPNGTSFDLPAATGTDMSGASGAEGDVNNHFFKMFASSFFTAWLADRVQMPQNVTINMGGASTTSPAGQVLVDVSKTILDRNKNIQPTITVEQGTRINVEVKRDMEFAGPYFTRSRM